MTISICARLLGVGVIAGAMCAPGQQVAPEKAPDQNAATPATDMKGEPVGTPGEIYKAAMRPLDIVRSSLDNWSDAEVGALAVGIQKAHDACEAANGRITRVTISTS